MTFKPFSYLLGLGLLASACTKPGDLGLSLVEGQRSDVVYTDTLTLNLKSVAAPPLIGSASTRFLVGSYQDPIFGQTNAGLYLNFRITSTNLTFPNATFDSLILELAYDSLGHYGDVYSNPSGARQTWEVLRMEEAMVTETSYKTNQSFQTGASLASNVSFVPAFRDSVSLASGMAVPHLRIALDASLGQELLSPASNIYATNNTFKSAFKGVYVRAMANSTNGSIMRFIPKHSRTRLVLHYTQPDENGVPVAQSVAFLTDEDSESLQFLQHDYQAGQGVLANNANDSLLYLQGMNGVGVEVEIPNLSSLGQIAINRAELQLFSTLPVDSLWRLPSQLVSFVANSDGGYDLSPDTENSLLKTGTYLLCGGYLTGDEALPYYSLSLAKSLQDVLNGDILNNRFYIQTSSIIHSERVSLGAANHSRLQAKLLLTYTRLD